MYKFETYEGFGMISASEKLFGKQTWFIEFPNGIPENCFMIFSGCDQVKKDFIEGTC